MKGIVKNLLKKKSGGKFYLASGQQFVSTSVGGLQKKKKTAIVSLHDESAVCVRTRRSRPPAGTNNAVRENADRRVGETAIGWQMRTASSKLYNNNNNVNNARVYDVVRRSPVVRDTSTNGKRVLRLDKNYVSSTPSILYAHTRKWYATATAVAAAAFSSLAASRRAHPLPAGTRPHLYKQPAAVYAAMRLNNVRGGWFSDGGWLEGDGPAYTLCY